MSDLVFLKALREKLKGGNIRSIHLNALPGRYATRLDLENLNYVVKGNAEHFLSQLFSKSCFEFKISFDGIDLNSCPPDEQKRLGLLSKRLNSINIENEDNFKEHGIKTFGFGFPLLIKPSKSDPKKIIKAPIFIWELEISKANNKVNTWSILRNKIQNGNGRFTDEEIHSVGLNEVLLSYLKSDEGIVIPQINEDLLEDAIIDQEELITECCKVLNAIFPEPSQNRNSALLSRFNEVIKPLPDSKYLDSQSGSLPWIHFGGVFGLFRTQKESIISDLDKLIERFNQYEFDNLITETFTSTAHSAVETDPSQQEIIATLDIERKKIIQGPPGTGKSQSLTALITNALANNLKCLVVCEKKTALDVIKNNLSRENAHLGELTAVIEDINKDRDAIVNSVRNRLGNLSQIHRANSDLYRQSCKILQGNAEEINSFHELLDMKIYQGKSWTTIVGEFLKKTKNYDYTTLQSRLDYRDFKFHKNDRELAEILLKLTKAKALFKEINVLDHPLNNLKDSVFSDEPPYGIQRNLETQIDKYLVQLCSILDTLQKQMSDYENWLNSHYSGYFASVKTAINEFEKFVSDNHDQYGDQFFKKNRITQFKINLYSYFSDRYKTLKQNRMLLPNLYLKVKEEQTAFKYFNHTFFEINKAPDLSLLNQDISNLSFKTETWFQGISHEIRSFVNNTSFSSAHSLYLNRKSLEIAEIEYKKLISEIMDDNVINSQITFPLSHYIKIDQTKHLISEFQVIKENLSSFRPYYHWRKFYITLTPLNQEIIHALVDAKSDNWEGHFESWYYYWLLAVVESLLKNLPINEEKIVQFGESKNQFKSLQINNIINSWGLKQYQSFKKIQEKGINPVSVYNKRGTRGEKRNSLRRIITIDHMFFTDFYPVVMVSPSVCSSILPLKEGLFDIVIFDEASQLRIEDTYPALLRGKIKVISGDSQQMPPSNFFQGGTALLSPTEEDFDEEMSILENETAKRQINNSVDMADSESLLVYAENCNYKPSFLKIHYRSNHPDLIEFSNHAFYGKRLIPMPEKQEYKAIQFIAVNGIYEDQVNISEARQVVDILLNHIKPLKNGKFPSVGIATFNLYQRNLILEEITKARQISQANDKKIVDLGTDFFVKNLENIQGDERDIIILSTTFGKRRDGTFRQNFGPVLQKNGYKLLNVIITRAKHKVIVCTSIPNEYYNTYSTLLDTMHNNGRAIFYAYLAYAKAISDGNTDLKKVILAQLFNHCEFKNFEITQDAIGSESPFEEEVYYRLAHRIGENRLEQQYQIGGFRIDLVVKSRKTGKPVIAIECDGAKYHSSAEAYAWDMFRQSRLENYGFIFHRIWSTNWWNSTEKEVLKVVEFINKFDRSESDPENEIIEEVFKESFSKLNLVPNVVDSLPKRKVGVTSTVTIKKTDGQVLKIKFCHSQQLQNFKPDSEGCIRLYDKSPLALAIMDRSEGEICQVGMLELYYEVVKIEKI